MVLRPEPIAAALAALDPRDADAQPMAAQSAPAEPRLPADERPRARRILLDPGGRRFDQALARELAAEAQVVLVCPRYEGVDDRVRAMVDAEVSIGDYVLSGGELPALVIIDAVLRLLPGAIDEASPVEESFSEGLLEYPQFTRPAEFGGVRVPDVLVSGHHAEVARWRAEQSVARTRRVRPDLLDAAAGWYTPPPTPRLSPRRSAARGRTQTPTPEVDSE